MIKYFSGIIAFLLLIGTSTQAQTICINEFQALNQSTLTDVDGEYSDWIEIYNPTSSPVDLQGYKLTDDYNEPNKWEFPDITLQPDEYLIVFASGKNQTTVGNELHTNFKLSGSGEYLALINTTGNKISEFNPSFPQQQSDYSYGLLDGEYVVFIDPTPGESNESSTGTIIPSPAFDVKHGFYNASFKLNLSSNMPGANIKYTTDGSTPGSLNGKLYTSPIDIESTTVIRAIAYTDPEIQSEVVTQTYIFPDSVIHQTNSPAGYPDTWGPYTSIEGSAIADYEMDPELMADEAYANMIKNSLLDIPTVSIVTDIDNLFLKEENEETGGIYIYTGSPLSQSTYGPGKGWERPASFEFFDNDTASVQVNCGLAVQGGHSRRPEKSPKHSFKLSFKSEYGPSRLDYSFFGEDGSGDYNKLIMRARFCNSWIHHSANEREIAQYERDIWSKDTQRDMGHPASNSIYAHLYINGIYWGLYQPTERMDNDFAAKYLGGDPEDYDVIKDYSEVADGSIDAWDNMMRQANQGLTSTEAYQRIQGNNPDGTPNPAYEPLVDVVNLADYMILNFYGSNTDWDHHNWAAMRNKKKPGKGFKFLSWDTEQMVKSVSGYVLNENNDNCPSHLHQQLMQNEDYKRLFADRIQKHCFNNGALTPEAAIERWLNRSDMVETSIRAESARWGDYRRDVHPYQTVGPFDLYTYEDHYLPQRDFMLNTYFPQRTDAFIRQLRNENLFPSSEAPTILLNQEPASKQVIEKGDVLSMTVPEGTIYYTTNGTDPVVWHTNDNSESLTLISEKDEKKVLVPTSNIGNTWNSAISFNDNDWKVCSGMPGGVGYENGSGYENLITLNVKQQMNGGSAPNASCYIRIDFTVEENELDDFQSFQLNVDYDDGFVAYLNGTKVAESNAPSTLNWNAIATANHEGGTPESFSIAQAKNLLKTGENLLAIHALNRSTTSSDFLINASLTASNEPSKGATSPDAILYTSPLSLEQSSHIVARTFLNGSWSAISNQFFTIPENYYDIKITEIHYHPLNTATIDNSEFEFVEIKNTGTSTLDIGNFEFIDGIEYTFPPETNFSPGEFIVLCSNKSEFYNRYGFVPFDEYNGKLSNDGERLILVSNVADTIIDVSYNDNSEWPQLADGDGYSLVPNELNPVNDQNIPTEWRNSFEVNGSPGEDDIYHEPVSIANLTNINNELEQNYPNPFSQTTYINYQIEEDAFVQLSVYNTMGQLVTRLVNVTQNAGLHQVTWDGSGFGGNQLPDGIYIYKITIQGQNKTTAYTKKMMLNR